MPQSVKMFFCDEFLEIIKHDFATEALSSNWFVWYEIEEYDMHLGIKKNAMRLTILMMEMRLMMMSVN